ncbi:MAG: mechanosensitive ion channel [Chlorobi bacterium]|nr:mechanosensitive ion channel [Chlorobiota bacterium]
MKNLKHFYFIILLVVISTQPFYSQNADTLKSEQITSIKLTDIPIELEKATSIVALEESKLKNSKIVEKVKQQFEKTNSNYDAQKSKLDSLNLNNQTSGKIKELLRQWQVVQNDVTSFLNDITDQTTTLEREKANFIQLGKVWRQTKEEASQKKIPSDLVKAITGLEKKVKNIEKLITNELNTLLVIQTNLSKNSIGIEKIITKIREIDNANRRNILVRNALPIWALDKDTTQAKPLNDELDDILNSYKTAYTEFLVTYKDDVLSFIVMFLLFLLFVISLKSHSKEIESEDKKNQESLIVFSYPLSATLLIFGILMSFFYGDAPAAFKSIVKIILLIPLVRISVKIINPQLVKALYVFSVLFVLNQVKVAASSATLIERLLLFGLEIISILGIIWLIKKNRFSENLYAEEKKAFVVLGRRIALSLFAISFIANIFGFVKLGIVLVNGIYETVFATFILIVGIIIIRAIVLVFLKTKFAQRSRVIQYQSEKIKHTTEKIVQISAKIIWIVIALGAFNIYVPVRDWVVKILTDEIGFGNFSTSLADIFLFIVTVWVSFKISRFIIFILDEDILPRLSLPRGVPGTISTLTKYFVIILGFLIAVSSVGLDLNKFTILIGALGVGIGFGLQDLVNNFISGLILIFERPIQVGDVVHFNQIEGRVTNIGIRSSRIKTWQGSEIIVPNGHLVSNDVINWTFSDKMRRIEIKVGVEYGCDVNQIKELLLSCAKANDRILSNPEPVVIFRDFGESSLDFELRSWTSNFDLWFTISSELRFAINKIFEENNITIPFPQRDIYIKTPKAADPIEESKSEEQKKKEE